VPVMFCVVDSLHPAICPGACARAVAAAPNHSHATQTIRMKLRRSMNSVVTVGGRESAKNITQGPNEKDGTSGHDGPPHAHRALERGGRIRNRFDRPRKRTRDCRELGR